MVRGEPTWSDDLLLPMDRYGYVEETYFTFSYSPIRDESGGVGGMLITCAETTPRVVGERRLGTLRDLGARTGAARTVPDACDLAMGILAQNAADVPAAALVSARPGHADRQACGTSRSPRGAPARPGGAGRVRRLAVAAGPGVRDRPGRGAAPGGLGRADRAAAGGRGPDDSGRCPARGGQLAPPPGRLLSRILRAHRGPHRERHRQRAGVRGGGAARRGAGRAGSGQDGILQQREPRVPDAADAAARSAGRRPARRPRAAARAPARPGGGGAPEQSAAAAAGEHAAGLGPARGGPDGSGVRAGGPCRPDGGPRQRLPFRRGAGGAPLHGGMPAADRAGVRRSGHVGEDRPQPAQQRAQVHGRRRDRGAAAPLTGSVRLEVRDTGTGIPADELPRIFERFHRVREARGSNARRDRHRAGAGAGAGEAARRRRSRSPASRREGSTFRVILRTGRAHLPDDQIGEPGGRPARRHRPGRVRRGGAPVAPGRGARPRGRQGAPRSCWPTTTPTCASTSCACSARDGGSRPWWTDARRWRRSAASCRTWSSPTS